MESVSQAFFLGSSQSAKFYNNYGKNIKFILNVLVLTNKSCIQVSRYLLIFLEGGNENTRFNQFAA